MLSLRNRLSAMSVELEDFSKITGGKVFTYDFDKNTVIQEGFDDSSWPPLPKDRLNPLAGGHMKRDQGITWIRFYYEVPEYCGDLPIKDSCIRLVLLDNRPLFAPVEIYLDGKLILEEPAWMDCRAPDVVIIPKAVPGTKHTIAVKLDLNEKCFWNVNFNPWMVATIVEDAKWEIDSILAELEYLEGFESAKPLLPKACDILEKAVETKSYGNIVKAIQDCRAVFEPIRSEVKAQKVHFVGHAHIDMNWFWSMEETIRIIGRDFSTMIKIMEQFPEFKFSQSQCAVYEITQKHFPDIFKKIQKYVKEGRWDITASTWVEGDLNMASGESVARHGLYSRNYLKEHFDDSCSGVMWSPDTFGHPANIPQMVRQSGLKYYYHMRCNPGIDDAPGARGFTEKSGHIPLYWWEGQDGSRILVGSSIYSRLFIMENVLLLAKRMKQGFNIDNSMFVFGVGDHGGGPSIRDIRRILKYADYPTVPSFVFSTTDEYFATVENEPGIPLHRGELNFVFDGCYTTHSDAKWYNRRCETQLEATEKILSLASLTGAKYPYAQMEEAWKTTLFNQFHDILDGAGVPDTYDYSAKNAEQVLKVLDALYKDAAGHIAKQVKAQAGKGDPYIVFNPCGWERDCLINLKGLYGEYLAADMDGNTYKCQNAPDGVRMVIRGVPAHGYKVFYLSKQKSETRPSITEDEKVYYIETKFYSAEIRKDSGQIITLFDKQNGKFVVRKGEVSWRMQNGVLNMLQVHYEEPTPMSAWTIGTPRQIVNLFGASSKIIMDGDVVKGIKFKHSIERSVIEQDILFYEHNPRIDFVTKVQWEEYGNYDRDAPMLKVYCSPSVKNTSVDYEIPFGIVNRPAYDKEVPALKWADISDGEYGMALLNDSKYGYRVRGNGMELTLIRSGWQPDWKSDIGKHCFTYSILPHKGQWQENNVLAEGYFLNNPAFCMPLSANSSGDLPESFSLFSCDNANVACSAIKLPEDGGGMLARVYNSTNEAVKVSFRCGFTPKEAFLTDFLERGKGESLSLQGNDITIQLKPYEIASIKISM